MERSVAMEDEISNHFEDILIRNRSIDKVNRDLQTMFKTGQPKSTRINYVYQLMTQHNVFPDVTNMKEDKSDAKSEEFRKLGNTYFSSKPPQFLHALSMYNKSICYAVTAENISTAIANRSAVLFNMQMYPECLESIRMAREIGVPERIEKKLADRAAICHGKIEKMPPKETFVAKIGMPVNENIPFLANCLKLRENKKFGKHIVTDEDIPAGTFIAIDEPYCKIVANTDKYLRCATCLLEVPHLLFPCDSCTQTMFCSNECKEKALKDFHTIECPINGALFKIFDSCSLSNIRLCIKGLLAFPDTEAMALGLRKMYKEQKTVFNLNWNEELTPEELRKPICTLPTGEEKIKGISVHMYVNICLTFKMLKSSPILCQRYMTTNAAEDIVKDFIFQNLLINMSNSVSYTHLFEFETPDFPREYAGAVSCIHKLISHSCSPNTCYIITGSTYGILTIKNIVAGEQLFQIIAGDGDGHFMTKSKSERQRDIYDRFGYLCECSACIYNYPQLSGLRNPLNIPKFEPINRTDKERQCFCHLLVATNKTNSEMALDYIHKYGHLYPSLDLCLAEHEIYTTHTLLYNPISLRLRRDFPNRCPNCTDRL